jgi:hypothetical protein
VRLLDAELFYTSRLGDKILKKLLLLTALFAFLAVPGTALADTLTFSPPATASNNTNTNPSNSNYAGGSGQFDLDHHMAYTWQVGGINLGGRAITGATITFKNIANWDTNANKLFVHLLDSAKSFATASDTRSATVNGVTSYQDASSSQNPVTSIFDDFDPIGQAALYAANPLVNLAGPNAGNTSLFQQSFNMVGQAGYVAQNFTYTFTAAQLTALAAYIANGGDIAFGIDPDCHFWNNGIVFTITTAVATPEPVSMVLLGSGLAGLYLRRRRGQKLS